MILRTFAPTLLLFVIFLERQICEYQSEDTGKNVSLAASDRRHGRFLNLFSVIRFSNVPCTTKIGINGTCYTEKQCSGITCNIQNVSILNIFLQRSLELLREHVLEGSEFVAPSPPSVAGQLMRTAPTCPLTCPPVSAGTTSSP